MGQIKDFSDSVPKVSNSSKNLSQHSAVDLQNRRAAIHCNRQQRASLTRVHQQMVEKWHLYDACGRVWSTGCMTRSRVCRHLELLHQSMDCMSIICSKTLLTSLKKTWICVCVCAVHNSLATCLFHKPRISVALRFFQAHSDLFTLYGYKRRARNLTCLLNK